MATAQHNNALEKIEKDRGQAFSAKGLLELVAEETKKATKKIESLGEDEDASISIREMFEMQMRMNRLGQCSEMASAVVSGANQAIISITRNVK